MTIFAIEGSKEALGQPIGEHDLNCLVALGKIKGAKVDGYEIKLPSRKAPLRAWKANSLVVWGLSDFIDTAKGNR